MSKVLKVAVTNNSPGPRYVHAVPEAYADQDNPATSPVIIEVGATKALFMSEGEIRSALSLTFINRAGQSEKALAIEPVGKSRHDEQAQDDGKPLAERSITQLRKLAKAEDVELTADDTTPELIAAAIQAKRDSLMDASA